MNKYIQNIIKEQFNVSNMNLNNAVKRNKNIFNKEGGDPAGIYDKMLNEETVHKYEIDYLNSLVSAVTVNSKDDLKHIIKFYSDNYQNESLNWLDVTRITNMTYLFDATEYNGDISRWSTSNVIHMSRMFGYSNFNQDISNWDVSHVINMREMFKNSEFNQDISGWDVSGV